MGVSSVMRDIACPQLDALPLPSQGRSDDMPLWTMR